VSDFKISVIVPVYNVEPYLCRCLDSLVNQTLRDIEIICINDSSPDGSLSILKKYAKKDNRIKIIDFKKNQGVSIARNSGMKAAKGEYIGFCDPDDYVDLNFYEKLYNLAKNKNADITKAVLKTMEIGTNIERIENINKRILKHKGYFTSQFTTAIYKKEMLKKCKIKFPFGKITGQDLCFSTHAVIAAKSVYVLNNVFYHYIRRDSSSSGTFNSQKMYSVLRCCSIVLNLINKAAKRDKNYTYICALWFQWLLWLLIKNPEEQIVKKYARTVIAYYHKCIFPVKLKLPNPIVAAIKEKNEKQLISLLQKWIYNEHYPFIIIRESILQSRMLYIWGTGEDGIRVKKQSESNGWKIAGFLDSNKKVKKYYRYKVERPEQILNKPKEDFFIIISSRKYRKEIAEICRKAGLKRGKNFWSPN
jgi:glycosyltransferase involved in cell wall biosynthesis